MSRQRRRLSRDPPTDKVKGRELPSRLYEDAEEADLSLVWCNQAVGAGKCPLRLRERGVVVNVVGQDRPVAS